jgi:hypothetical protein
VSVKPITPAEVPDVKAAAFPDEVLEAFNECIAERFSGYQAVVSQDEVVDRIVSKLNRAEIGATRGEVFRRGWLDVEEVYEKAGWIVSYDKPGFNEDYPASFTFRKKGGRLR